MGVANKRVGMNKERPVQRNLPPCGSLKSKKRRRLGEKPHERRRRDFLRMAFRRMIRLTVGVFILTFFCRPASAIRALALIDLPTELS